MQQQGWNTKVTSINKYIYRLVSEEVKTLGSQNIKSVAMAIVARIYYPKVNKL